MLIYDERSWNVYENKETVDRMTGKVSDIYGNLPWILQNFPAFEGHFAGICAFDAGFGGLARSERSAATRKLIKAAGA
ncbi:MAG: hypothetical protein P4N24_06110 [Acidobacteriota bacterium]|nr:hypothetical protein [Acidobacteriota bacterium]